MSRLLCLLLCFSSFAFAQTSNTESQGSAPSSAVQIVYTIDGSTLTTYNVDPETLQAAPVGTTPLLESIYPGLITSQNGHFIYYTAYKDYSQDNHELYVYDTNASGVPNGTPVQQISIKPLIGLVAHPDGKFLYSVEMGPSNGQTSPFAIVRNLIDQSNGRLGASATEAKYVLDTESSGNDCYLAILGFNHAGTTMYDAILCSGPHGSGTSTYYEREVDLQTGALGPDKQVYTWNTYAGSDYENVQFRNNLMFDFAQTMFSGDSVNVYRVQPNVSTPLINCTSSMSAVCGNFQYSLAHPSGQYVFLFDSTNTTNIGKVNLSTKQIVQTGSIPYEVQEFSPDGSIAYGVNDVNGALEIEIYGFNASSGEATQGGIISVPSDLDSWFATERN
jgi:hypothetical protein